MQNVSLSQKFYLPGLGSTNKDTEIDVLRFLKMEKDSFTIECAMH